MSVSICVDSDGNLLIDEGNINSAQQILNQGAGNDSMCGRDCRHATGS